MYVFLCPSLPQHLQSPSPINYAPLLLRLFSYRWPLYWSCESFGRFYSRCVRVHDIDRISFAASPLFPLLRLSSPPVRVTPGRRVTSPLCISVLHQNGA
ncbi:unnamed protein product [Eruca vesicaria subsp. sativa]|uniref:Uncharacterized protein n=1 Tax=Eruca vesicaria subsp. sativa TaxID=29727 RepID=A0ABC8L3J7_ERUVS|nr:unnamed protein product [Eruca vesicaria subsp. sativa]